MSMKSLNNRFFLPKLLTINEKVLNNHKRLNLVRLLSADLYDLLYIANKIREKYHGNKIGFCSIINAKSGRCSEDCRYCAQSSHYNSKITEYSLKNTEEILSAALLAQKNGSPRFCIVTSGKGILDESDWAGIIDTVKMLKKKTSLKIEASLGCLDFNRAKQLKRAGIARYNHNLETSPIFFPKICTTHTFGDRLRTAEAIKKARMELCSGGLFGMGETWEDRIELAYILKKLRPDSIPMNFLHPKTGTPLFGIKQITPQEILRIISLYRIILPGSDISVCGGREHNLRSLQSWMFYAGANATMLGNYLTTKGNPPEQDIQMIKDLGLCPEQH